MRAGETLGREQDEQPGAVYGQTAAKVKCLFRQLTRLRIDLGMNSHLSVSILAGNRAEEQETERERFSWSTRFQTVNRVRLNDRGRVLCSNETT